MTAIYNEIEAYPAAWLRNLNAAGHIAPGSVDERSIIDLKPEDVRGATQAHFFAGIGVWSHALRSATELQPVARPDQPAPREPVDREQEPAAWWQTWRTP